jgi:predicted acyl esterase
VPMRDGVVLLADHYAPTGRALGTLLVRGPYGRSGPFPLLFARIYAEHPATGRTLRPSHRTIAHGAGGVSRLLLPVTSG